MITLKIYEVFTCDGGSVPHYRKCYLKNKEDADLYKELNPSDYIEEKTIVVFESIPELNGWNIQLKKNIALSKLTEEERKLLGL